MPWHVLIAQCTVSCLLWQLCVNIRRDVNTLIANELTNIPSEWVAIVKSTSFCAALLPLHFSLWDNFLRNSFGRKGLFKFRKPGCTEQSQQSCIWLAAFCSQGIFKRILLVGQICHRSVFRIRSGGRRIKALRAEVRGPRPWVGFLRRRELKGLGSAVSSPSGVRGEAPAAVDFEGFGTSQNVSWNNHCLTSRQVNWNLVHSHVRDMAPM